MFCISASSSYNPGSFVLQFLPAPLPSVFCSVQITRRFLIYGLEKGKLIRAKDWLQSLFKWVFLLSCLNVPSVSFFVVDSLLISKHCLNACSEKTGVNVTSSELLEKLNGLNSDHSLHSNLQPFSISFFILSDCICIQAYTYTFWCDIQNCMLYACIYLTNCINDIHCIRYPHSALLYS